MLTDMRRRAKCLEQVWGGVIPSAKGLTAPRDDRCSAVRKIKALYVVGANPLAHFGTLGYGRGKAQLLVVHDMFLTETAKLADIVLPAASAYEKDGTLTNTAGEVQMMRKGVEIMGPRTDFDFCASFRTNSQAWAWAKPFTTESRSGFEEIRNNVPGYDVQPDWLAGGRSGTRAPGLHQQWARALRRASGRSFVRRRFPVHQRQLDPTAPCGIPAGSRGEVNS